MSKIVAESREAIIEWVDLLIGFNGLPLMLKSIAPKGISDKQRGMIWRMNRQVSAHLTAKGEKYGHYSESFVDKMHCSNFLKHEHLGIPSMTTGQVTSYEQIKSVSGLTKDEASLLIRSIVDYWKGKGLVLDSPTES